MALLSNLGSAVSRPGAIEYGRWEALEHPTGHTEFLPVILAQGKKDGPTLWLTAGIHGVEHAGPVVLYRLITQELVERMCGQIVAIPALNPAGLRTAKREPYHAPTDPNRLWPDGKLKRAADTDIDPPSSLEIAYSRLYEVIAASADAMIDFHNAWTGSLSFAFRDRILYRADGDPKKAKNEALALSEMQLELLKAYGHTIVSEFSADKLIDEVLHRSTTFSTLALGKIPSFTVELGTGEVPDPDIVRAAVAGTRNVMRRLGMLDGAPELIEGIQVIDLGFPVRRSPAPRVPQACVVLHLLEAGERFSEGQPLAETRDVWGRPVGEGVLKAPADGFVIGRHHGIYYYPGDAIYHLAVRDTASPVAPYPKDYFQED